MCYRSEDLSGCWLVPVLESKELGFREIRPLFGERVGSRDRGLALGSRTAFHRSISAMSPSQLQK